MPAPHWHHYHHYNHHHCCFPISVADLVTALSLSCHATQQEYTLGQGSQKQGSRLQRHDRLTWWACMHCYLFLYLVAISAVLGACIKCNNHFTKCPAMFSAISVFVSKNWLHVIKSSQSMKYLAVFISWQPRIKDKIIIVLLYINYAR